jgi:hypothetical protein
MMTNPLTLYDLSQLRIEDRAREAQTDHLIQYALGSQPARLTGFRFRFATTLRNLANRLEPAPELAGCTAEALL